MRVVVTGAGGFIGRHCLKYLRQSGYEVCAISSKPRASDDIEWRQVNLFDRTQVRDLLTVVRPTHLLHLAWLTTPGEYWTSAENLPWVSASLDLLHAFQARGGERVVMAGTCAEYEWGSGPCVEAHTRLTPLTLYGSCKHALHTILEAFSRQTHLSSAWGRIFFTFGPYEHPSRLVPSVVTSLLAGQPAECSIGTQARDFLFVEDVAAAFVALLGSSISGSVNVASGQAVTIRSVVSEVAALLHAPELVRFGARSLPPGEPPVIVADTTRLTREVGWQPRFSLAQGLEVTVRWYQERSAVLPPEPLTPGC